MSQAQLPYVLLYLCSTFLSAVSQVLLKKAALREHKSVLAEYTDWRVILGYALFVGCTLLTMLAYKGVPLNVGPVLEATGYIYVTIFGVTIFHEKMNPKKLAALAMILVGILVYALERKTSCLQHCADRTFFIWAFGISLVLFLQRKIAKKEPTYSLLQPFRYAALAALHRASLQNGGGMIQQQRQQ